MTDRGSRARWTTAALVAPAAAALFTGTTVWASTNQPGVPTAGSKPTTLPTPSATAAAGLEELRAGVAATSARVEQLRQTVSALVARATGAPAPAASSRSGSSGSSRTSTASRTTTTTRATASPAPAPRKTVAPAPRPVAPPPTQSTTGASGSP